uniref:MBL fold metallo-hydrolase RNA specificity domain-containing protein n=1 Tax=Ndongobacter massiliensis TaxID=1871025 RepID=UPI00093048A8|nr:MBL fold metallo-hydrolase [Ndongobacter massiliensis]
MKLAFYGAAQMVTGSNYYVETEGGTRFIVDCGMFQGLTGGAEDALNAQDFPFAPQTLDFALLTHAHIDHSGRLPKLVADGFQGPIHATKASCDLCEVMLYDSAKIQRQDAENENRKRTRQGKPLMEPLYTEVDVEKTLSYFSAHRYGEVIPVAEDVKIRFRDAGHILGSSIIEVWITEKGRTNRLCFSGDLGMRGHLLMCAPETPDACDTLLLESTYGDSAHGSYEDSLGQLTEIIGKVAARGGTVVIPSFAIGRTQELVYELNNYYEYHDVPKEARVPIYVDSPLASRATAAFMRNTDAMNKEAQEKIARGDNIFAFDNLHYVTSVEESRALNADRNPKVIISASGMATAGRVRHHLKHNLWNRRNAVVFVGYQAAGTLGRLLKDGADKVKLFGEWIDVKAKIYDLPGFSAHADRPALLAWLDALPAKPKKVFLVHGEPEPMQALAEAVAERGIEVFQPHLGDVVVLDSDRETRTLDAGAPLPDLKDIAATYGEVQALLDAMEDRPIALERLPEERLHALHRNLNELKANLLEFNMVTGH